MAQIIAAEAAVLLVPSTRDFLKKLRADLEPQLAKFRPEVVVKPVLDKKALADVAAEIEGVKSLDKAKVRLGVTLDKSSLASSVAEIEGLQKALGAKSVKIKVNSDDVDSARKKTQSLDRELSGLSSQATKGILLRVAFIGLPAALAGIASLNTSIVELSRSALLLPGILAGGVSIFATLATGALGVKDAITAANKAQETAAQSAEKLANANRSVSDAQRDLNRAYKDAKRNLEDLYDQMRDAPLDEAEARLRLDKARTEESIKWGKTQLQRQEDTINRMRAENDLASAQQKNTRTAEDFNEAQQKGITGSDQVVSATERLTKAVETLNQTASKGSLSDEMAKLAPAGQAFVKQLESMRTQWTAFRQDVQQHLFAGLDQEVTQLGTLLPTVKTGFDHIADSLNNNVKTAISSLTSQGSRGLLDQIFGNTADAQRILSTSIDPLIHSMLQLSSTSSAALPKLATGFGNLSQTFDGFITKAARDGSLDKWIDDGIKAAKNLGDTFLNIGKIMGDFSDIFTSAGGKGLGELLKEGTADIHSFLTSAQGQAEVKVFFQDILEATRAWGPILHDIPGLLTNVVKASGTIGSVVLPILKAMADLLSSDNIAIQGVIAAFLAWKTFHPIITATSGLLDRFTGSTKTASEAVGEEGAATSGKGLRGRLAGMAGFLKSAGWTAVIAATITGIDKLGDAHDRATAAAAKQQATLQELAGTLDRVTGSATPDTIAKTSAAFQNYTLPSGKQVNLNSDAAGLGINPSDAVSAAADPTQQGKKDQILAQLDKQTQSKIESSDQYKRSKPFWDAAGIDIATLAKATNGDPASVARVQAALKTPIDKLPFGLGDAYRGLVNIIDGALPASATPGAAPTLQDFSNDAGASSSLALGIRDTSKGLGDQSRADANSSNVASGAPKGWQLNPSNPFSAYSPDGTPSRDASKQGFITLNSVPPKTVLDQWAQNGWQVSAPVNGRITVTVPPEAADQFLKPIPGYASGGQLSGPGSGTSDSMLARVSDGEFISNAASVNRYGPGFYHALNSGAVDPSVLPGFAGGDEVNIPLAPPPPVPPPTPPPNLGSLLVPGPGDLTPRSPGLPIAGLPGRAPAGTGLQPSPNAPLIDGVGQLPVQVGGGKAAGPGGPIIPSPGGGAITPGVVPSLSADVPAPSAPSVPDLPRVADVPPAIPPGAVAPPPAPDIPPPPPPGILGGLGQVFNPASILQRLGEILISGFLGFFGINPQPILALIQQITGGLGGKGDGGKGILGHILGQADPAVQGIIQNQPGRNQQFDPGKVGQLPGASGPPSVPPGAAAPSGNVGAGGWITGPDGTRTHVGINPATQANIPLTGSTTDAVLAAKRSGAFTNQPLYTPGTNSGGYGNTAGVPGWAIDLGAQFGLKPSTYGDPKSLHGQGYAFDFAADPNLSRDEQAKSLDAFATFIEQNLSPQTLELIHANSKTGQHWGVAGAKNQDSTSYYSSPDQWTGHDDYGPEPHVHWATDVAPTIEKFSPWFPGGGPAGVKPPAAAPSGFAGPVLNPASNQTDVARAIIGQAQARGYGPQQQQAILSAAYQESGLSPTASGGGGAWHGIFQQDGGYPGRDDPNQNISAFLDRLGSHGGTNGDIWKNIFWLQQRPGEASADSAFANGRQGYLSEIQSKLGPASALYNQIVNAQGHATGGLMSLPRFDDGGIVAPSQWGSELAHAGSDIWGWAKDGWNWATAHAPNPATGAGGPGKPLNANTLRGIYNAPDLPPGPGPSGYTPDGLPMYGPREIPQGPTNWVSDALGNWTEVAGEAAFASGGMLSGPGTGTSDSILARVSDGEFITKAASVQKYGPDFFHALNNGVVDPGMLQGFAAGGQPDTSNDELKKLLKGVPDAAQVNGPLPGDTTAQHLQDQPDVSAQHLQGNGPLDFGSLGGDAGQLTAPTPPDQPTVSPPVTDISPDPSTAPPTGAVDQPDPRSTPGVGPTSQQQQHTAPWLDQAVKQGIEYAGQIGAAVVSSLAGAAGSAAPVPGAGAGAGAAGAAAGIAISQGAQVAAQAASGVLNVISSAGVGSLTPGTTAGAYGQPLLPQKPQQQTAGPAIINQYGDIHTASYDQFYQGQQLREAQQMQPYLTSLPG